MKKLLNALRRAGRAVGGALDWVDAKLRGWLDGSTGWVQIGVFGALVVAAFYVIAGNCRYEICDTYSPYEVEGLVRTIANLFTGLFAITLVGLFVKMKRQKASTALFILMAAVWVCTMIVRISLLDFVSGDYEEFLSGWVYRMQDDGFAGSISVNFGDYTPPYLYFVFLISRFAWPDLYLIKLVSIAFDYLCAYFVMRLVSLKYKSLLVQLSAMMLTLWAPTVLFNGAYWGQCDSIYTSFAVGGLYFALAKKPWRAMACFGISFAFKLQAVFLLPMMLPLFGMRRISLKHVLMLPLAYVAMMAPALLAGKPVDGILEVYRTQIGNYPQLTNNAASVFTLMPGVISYRIFYNLGIYLTLSVSVLFCGFLYAKGRKITNDIALAAALTLAMAMPLLLPCMHERYFFIADVLAVAYLVCNPKRWYIACSMLFASFVMYYHGEGGEVLGVLSIPLVAMLLVVMTGLSAMHVARDLRAQQ